MRLTVEKSRQYWFTLMANVVSLVLDANVLVENGSPGRARSLLILAQEELARAYALYVSASDVWNQGAGHVDVEESHLAVSRQHLPKIEASDMFAGHLGPFWGDYDDIFEERDPKSVNLDKQRGFYVDDVPSAGGRFHSPFDIELEPVKVELIRTAKLAEMSLIVDNSRITMWSSCEESRARTHQLHNLILPIAHPEESFRRHPFDDGDHR